MKTYLLLLTLFNAKILFAQEHNTDTSFVNNKRTFNIQTRDIDSEHVTLTIYRNSKIIKVDTLDAGGLSYPEFPDFNKDGNKDIMLVHMGNNFTYYLYLFDKTHNEFKFVKGFDRFPEATQLKANSQYYYSYQRAGCADMNWVSNLFYIEDFKTIFIGQIYGKGCDADLKNEPRAIEIYKVIDNNEDHEKLIGKLSYLKNIPLFERKWDFIKRYWEKNYSKFIHVKKQHIN